MDDLTRKVKKMMLFLHRENSFWKDMKTLDEKTEPARRARRQERLMVVSATSVGTWRKGNTPSEKKVAQFEATLTNMLRDLSTSPSTMPECRAQAESLITRLEAFEVCRQDDSISIYEAASALGMSKAQARAALDTEINTAKPLFKGAFIDSKAEARDHIQAVEGTYALWLRRDNAWIQCLLRVKPLLPLKMGFIIRAKLDFPIADPDGDVADEINERTGQVVWKYDGVVSVRARRYYWMFERRRPGRRHDFLQLITCSGTKVGDSKILYGSYLATGQCPDQPILTGEVLAMRSNDGKSDNNNTIGAQDLVPKLLSANDAQTQYVNGLLNELRRKFNSATEAK